MKIAVCDDDKNDIARLKGLIKAYDADNNIGFSVSEYESGSELLRAEYQRVRFGLYHT